MKRKEKQRERSEQRTVKIEDKRRREDNEKKKQN